MLLIINYFHHLTVTLSLNVDKFSESHEATFTTIWPEFLFFVCKTTASESL